MQREDYMAGVSVACKEGMTPEEVQSIFKFLYTKSNDPKHEQNAAKKLQDFAMGVGGAKIKGLNKKRQQEQVEKQPQNIQEKSSQYVYK